MSEGVVHLKQGKERKIRNFYPWVQRGECRVSGVENGAVARLLDSDGGFLAMGTVNSVSRFQFRVLSLEDRPIDSDFFHERFSKAVVLRDGLSCLQGTDARRVVFSESDGVPGLIVDQYGRHLVIQVRSLGMERLKPVWLPVLADSTNAESIYERSEMAGREEEGLGPVAGQLLGETPDEVTITESGLSYLVHPKTGLKTGFYLDQRETRRVFSERVRAGDKVLDAFCFSGSFALVAAKKGANAIGTDLNEEAIQLARRNVELNGVEAVFTQANAFEFLEGSGLGPYDWIVLDPPAIAKTREKRDSLKWAVWKLVHAALQNLKPGGRLIVCSCTYQLGLQELIETCRLAGSDRGRRICLEQVTMQDLDHPAPVWFPESLYLKCAWLRAD